MATPFIGQIIIFAGNFTIRDHAMCNGQILSIAQNTALFSLLGTTYGGNGQTTFALPNLQGRVPVHYGQGAGLSPRSLGESGGSEQVTLLSNQMPAHTHTATAATTLNASNSAGNSGTPTSNVPANTGRTNIYQTGAPDVALDGAAAATSVSVGIAGSSQPHENMPPFLALNYLIALSGLFPSRT